MVFRQVALAFLAILAIANDGGIFGNPLPGIQAVSEEGMKAAADVLKIQRAAHNSESQRFNFPDELKWECKLLLLLELF